MQSIQWTLQKVTVTSYYIHFYGLAASLCLCYVCYHIYDILMYMSVSVSEAEWCGYETLLATKPV